MALRWGRFPNSERGVGTTGGSGQVRQLGQTRMGGPGSHSDRRIPLQALMPGRTCIAESESDDMAEVFSPPRVVPFARALHLHAPLGMDILTGADLHSLVGRVALGRALVAKRPWPVALSPPWTV